VWKEILVLKISDAMVMLQLEEHGPVFLFESEGLAFRRELPCRFVKTKAQGAKY
jgi:hypothetical protein